MQQNVATLPPTSLFRWHEAEALAGFRRRIPALSLVERTQLVDTAIGMIADYYVHLPLKQASHGIDPVARLRALRRRLPDMPSDAGFHTALADVFDGLLDLHTNYLLPASLADSVAFLPLRLGEIRGRGRVRVIVTHVAAGFEGAAPGDEITGWNGIPMPRALERAASRTAGANPAASRAQALAALTMRPLAKRPPPDEDWVTMLVRGANRQETDLRVPWRVLDLPRRAERSGASVDIQVDALRRARRMLFPEPSAPPRPGWTSLPSPVPRNFVAATFQAGGTVLGYLRIPTFLTADADAFVQAFSDLLAMMPPHGLVLDIRDNGGGLVVAAERCLQMLTPHPIEPAPLQLRATQAALDLCRTPGSGLDGWAASLEHALDTGGMFSAALPLSDRGACNAIGQRYHGPVVLITSALCYSATDIFAGGFQDHGIGPVLGVHDRTGGGGANVWPHSVLARTLAGAGEPAAPLPQGAELRVALRRSLRVGPNAGLEMEERGVLRDEPHQLTRRDLLEGDPDLLTHAARLLRARPWRTLVAAVAPGSGDRREVLVRTCHLDRLDTWHDGRPILSQDIAGGKKSEIAQTYTAPCRVEWRGYWAGELVAARRLELTSAGP